MESQTPSRKNAAVAATTGRITPRDARRAGSGLSNNISDPITMATTPPTVKAPCVGANTSITNKTTARMISAMPA